MSKHCPKRDIFFKKIDKTWHFFKKIDKNCLFFSTKLPMAILLKKMTIFGKFFEKNVKFLAMFWHSNGNFPEGQVFCMLHSQGQALMRHFFKLSGIRLKWLFFVSLPLTLFLLICYCSMGIDVQVYMNMQVEVVKTEYVHFLLFTYILK